MLNLDRTRFIRINPAAEAYRSEMNEILKGKEGYVCGLEFTVAEQMDDGTIQFFYTCPEELDAIQKAKAESLIKGVYVEFMSSCNNL